MLSAPPGMSLKSCPPEAPHFPPRAGWEHPQDSTVGAPALPPCPPSSWRGAAAAQGMGSLTCPEHPGVLRGVGLQEERGQWAKPSTQLQELASTWGLPGGTASHMTAPSRGLNRTWDHTVACPPTSRVLTSPCKLKGTLPVAVHSPRALFRKAVTGD